MRILITEQGENTIKQIEDSNEYQRAKTLTYGNTFRKSKKNKELKDSIGILNKRIEKKKKIIK